MDVQESVFRELIKRGYSKHDGTRVWDISDSKLWYMTPELVEGFLRLEQFGPYKKNILAPEISLFKAHTPHIISLLEADSFNLIDMGCGDGLKSEIFVRHLPPAVRVRYCPVDISPQLIRKAVNRIRALRSGKVREIKTFSSDFGYIGSILGVLRSNDYQKNLCLLLGSTLSTFEINGFLYQISRRMFPGDVLVIGNGIRKGRRFVDLPKYRHPILDQWFVHIMRYLGFSDDEVSFDVRFANGRLEGLYKITTDKIIQRKGRRVAFKKGDEVVVMMQYKYYAHELQKFCEMYFRNVELFKDKREEFALVLCVK